MIQQVNLYQDILKPAQTKPLINAYIYSLIAMTISLLGYSIFLYMDLSNIKNDIQTAKQQLTEAESNVQKLRIQYPARQINKMLVQEISRSENILNSLTQVIHLLTDKTSDQTQGFSRYFSAFARQSTAKLWLTKFAINSKPHTLDIQGSTYQVDKTALFLQKLHHEPIFQGHSFAKLSMTQAKENDGQIDFIISTMNEPLKREDND